MKWILILSLIPNANNGGSVHTVPVPFETKKACDTAGETWLRATSAAAVSNGFGGTRSPRPIFTCVPTTDANQGSNSK